MKGIKEFGALMMSTGIIALVLHAYFNWRARLLKQIGIERSV